MEKFNTSNVVFLAEQDGPSEREFQRLVIPLLRAGGVARAYLVRIQYDSSSPEVVALCLRSRNETASLMTRIGEVFHSIFAENQHIDMMFIDARKEKRLRRVCRPFHR